MIRLKLIGITVAMLCYLSLFGMVKSSHSFEITSMSVANGASGCYVNLTADEDIDFVFWYIEQGDGLEPVHASEHGPETRMVYENIGYLTGSPFGKNYTIKAVAVRWVFNPLAKLPIETTTSDSYDLTVYSSPVTREKTGSTTMAQMSASVDVGWNGRTAEVSGSASITSYSTNEIDYGFNMLYSVVRLTPNNNWGEKIWNQPGILIENGRLNAENDSTPGRKNYSPDSDSYDGSWLIGGFDYIVQAEITVTAQNIDAGKDIDELNVSDSDEIYISLGE